MRILSRRRLISAAALVAVLAAALPAQAVTDDEVLVAIEKGKEYLINTQAKDGSFRGESGGGPGDVSCLVYMTLAYMGLHPNREVMSRGLDYILGLSADVGLQKPGYSLPMRTMALSYVHNKLLGDMRAKVRLKMYEDVLRYRTGQTPDGGWRYKLEAGGGWDFSNSQWEILAMREASLVGIELYPDVLLKAQRLYYEKQNADGGWSYQGKGESYGSMSAAGAASIYILADLLDPGSGCPCRGGSSPRTQSEADRRIDMALDWLSKNYTPTANPGRGRQWHYYWLYSAERVGIAAGYKYFGNHDWYREGAEFLVRQQKGDGSWGGMVDTCFALLFLYKGRAPVLFNKLQFKGLWNMHRRDMANLTHYIERTKEQMFHWQIVNLRQPVEELHDAPILYITAESVPEFSDEEKAKLRRFTDTGGTILFEASCGNPPVRSWFTRFAREVWPEWRLGPIGSDHGVFLDPYPLPQRPELLGISDGLRTVVFFALDDVSCPWHTKAYTGKQYLFNWGINLVAYATDHSPLRAKLAAHKPEKEDRYKGPLQAGPRSSLRVARVEHPGNWEVGANYRGFQRLAEAVHSRAGVSLEVTEAAGAPFDKGGVAPDALSGYDAAYLAGSKAVALTPPQKAALKAYADAGGFLWLEAAGGAAEFDQSLRKLCQEMGWRLEILPQTHGLATGRLGGALGHNVALGVEFRRSLRLRRLARQYAEFWAVFDGSRMIGLYSPFDVMFSLCPYEAYKCHGYRSDDALAVATNIVLYLTTRGSPAAAGASAGARAAE